MIYNINRQYNIHNNISAYQTNNIKFASSYVNKSVLQETKRTIEPMYDNGTNVGLALKNIAKNIYKQKFNPPIALLNMLYLDMDNLKTWKLITDVSLLNLTAINANKMFKNKKLIPFAKSTDNNEMAYFDISSSKIIVNKGDVQIESFKSYKDWTFSIINNIFKTTSLKEKQNNEFSVLEETINNHSKDEFKCPNGYKQARLLNLTRFLDGWTMPNILESDLINYSSNKIIPFACSKSGTSFAAFVNKGEKEPNVTVGTIYPSDRKKYAVTKNDSLIMILEHYTNFEDWFKKQMEDIFNAETY